jgi:predicted MFS family arabinose efflux permease
VGGLIGGGVALAVRPRRPLLLSESFIVLLALPVALLALPAHTLVIALGALGAGTAIGLAEVLWETVAAQQVPQEALSRVMAYDWFGSLAIEPLGLMLIGPLAAGVGISTTLWIAAGVTVLCQVLVLMVPSVRRLEAKSYDTPTPLPARPVGVGD